MKRLLTILLSLVALTCMAQKQNWLENLVDNLSSRSNIDRTVAVNRSPSTHEIINATYDFRFSSSNLYKIIASDLRNHSNNVDFYSEETAQNKDRQKVILMRFTDDNHRWSCRLQPLSNKNKQFIVTVTSVDKSYPGDTSTGNTNGTGKQSHRKSHRSKPDSSASPDNTSSSNIDELYKELDRAKQERNRKLNN